MRGIENLDLIVKNGSRVIGGVAAGIAIGEAINHSNKRLTVKWSMYAVFVIRIAETVSPITKPQDISYTAKPLL
jgi:hypothetical protein